MKKSNFWGIAAAAAVALLPVASLSASPLQVNLNGFQRVIAYSTAGPTCDVLPPYGTPTAVNCPQGAIGTLTLYGANKDMPVCEVDFWTDNGRWHADVPRQNGGTCTLNWQGGSTVGVTLR